VVPFLFKDHEKPIVFGPSCASSSGYGKVTAKYQACNCNRNNQNSVDF